MIDSRARPLVDREHGLVARRIFSDPAVYEQELDRVFPRCWLFLAHESMLPRPGDFLTTAMGSDPVIVVRGKDGELRAFLNTCRHRGNRVCLFDQGNASTFACSYHGWSYNTEGELTGVPFAREAYYERLDRSEWGLPAVPRLRNYAGYLFGCWDDAAPDFEEYLGDLKWYWDLFMCATWNGGLEVVNGPHRYMVPGNWKIMAENLMGDHYHTSVTHGSFFKLGQVQNRGGYEDVQNPNGPFEVAMRPAHGCGGVYTGQVAFERDLQIAERMGPDVVDYTRERYQRLQRLIADVPCQPYSVGHGGMFPNFCWSGNSSATSGRTFYLLQPKGPLQTEVWVWYMVEQGAPRAVREAHASVGGRAGQLASGFFAQDDAENFERVTESSRGVLARRFPFNYQMQLGREGDWEGQADWNISGLPGQVGPRFGESIQRQFFGYWSEMMGHPTEGGSACE